MNELMLALGYEKYGNLSIVFLLRLGLTILQ
jgi:hypothetical protein